MALPIHRCVWGDFGRGGLFGTVGQFDFNATCLCHDCLFFWRCNPVTARLNAAILGACSTYYFGAAAEALYSPGFQMSFATTIALVSVFDFITRRGWGTSGLVLNYITGAIVSSVVAGLATAPIAAIHFNQISQIGYIANLLAVPVMALVVAPAAVIALALSPLHLAPVGFWFVDLGLTWIQFTAGYLAEFELAVRMIKTPMGGVLPLFSFGVLWCVLWSGKYGKVIGIIAVCLALGMWTTTQRPEILISDQGRALSKEKAQGFVADVWMENDGIKLDRRDAHDLWQRLDHNITHI